VLEGDIRGCFDNISFLRERVLVLAAEKAVVTDVDQGFEFLGQNVRRHRGKLLIKPSKKNIHTFREKVREVVKRAQAYPTCQLIANLSHRVIPREWFR
jgi:RNA-directed DNA polymerase